MPTRTPETFPSEGRQKIGVIPTGELAPGSKPRLAESTLRVTVPFVGAAQVHQAVLPLAPPGRGSPGSSVAKRFDPVMENASPANLIRLLKSSFGGGNAGVEIKFTLISP